jgi:3-oxoacyl-[acyl-carrier protein] reductase
MAEVAGRSILITGSSGEIGSHLARHFADAGWRVLGVDRSAPAFADAGAAIAGLVRQYGAADVLVNCAARIANAPLVTRAAEGWQLHDSSLWDEVIAAGLTSAFHATASCVRHMIEARKKGVVINISSICANGSPGQVAYSAAKAGLNGLTLALAKELGPVGIRVVGLAPGFFDTASTARHVVASKLAKLTAAVPLRRLGRVEEIADAIEFIIRNEYMNGTIVELDGGLVV